MDGQGASNRQTVHRQLGSHLVTLNKSGGVAGREQRKSYSHDYKRPSLGRILFSFISSPQTKALKAKASVPRQINEGYSTLQHFKLLKNDKVPQSS